MSDDYIKFLMVCAICATLYYTTVHIAQVFTGVCVLNNGIINDRKVDTHGARNPS